jgi:hypothetical protein
MTSLFLFLFPRKMNNIAELFSIFANRLTKSSINKQIYETTQAISSADDCAVWDGCHGDGPRYSEGSSG